MPDFNVVSFVGTIISVIFLGLILLRLLQLMDAGIAYLKNRTMIDREKYEHEKLNGRT